MKSSVKLTHLQYNSFANILDLCVCVCWCTYRFYPVSDAHNEFAVFLHFVDKLHRQHATVERLTELLSSCVQGTSKTVPLNTNRTSDETDALLMLNRLYVEKSFVSVQWSGVPR